MVMKEMIFNSLLSLVGFYTNSFIFWEGVVGLERTHF